MAAIKTRQEATDRAAKRWRKPENVERRVDALAARIQRFVETAPPLTPEQADRLAALLRPTEGGADDA